MHSKQCWQVQSKGVSEPQGKVTHVGLGCLGSSGKQGEV